MLLISREHRVKILDAYNNWKYSRTPEIETANLSQSHAALSLSQFQTDCLVRIKTSKAILNYFKFLNQYLAL